MQGILPRGGRAIALLEPAVAIQMGCQAFSLIAINVAVCKLQLLLSLNEIFFITIRQYVDLSYTHYYAKY